MGSRLKLSKVQHGNRNGTGTEPRKGRAENTSDNHSLSSPRLLPHIQDLQWSGELSASLINYPSRMNRDPCDFLGILVNYWLLSSTVNRKHTHSVLSTLCHTHTHMHTHAHTHTQNRHNTASSPSEPLKIWKPIILCKSLVLSILKVSRNNGIGFEGINYCLMVPRKSFSATQRKVCSSSDKKVWNVYLVSFRTAFLQFRRHFNISAYIFKSCWH